ncbi:Nif11-like leader peptide family natural product precursor [Leptolyngbya sp. AN03gr2]|uniref:Nif11-like leader peptide family natural product precursor n=1 Tax=unclassified Leptolyngbya TaxID=2650499 RepID=UPI003D314A8A
MSQANVEQFIQLAAKDTALQEQLKSSTSMQDFQTKMVELGKQKGHTFVQEDVASYMQAQAAQTTGRSPSEKLTEEELETVGGGSTPLCIVGIGNLAYTIWTAS